MSVSSSAGLPASTSARAASQASVVARGEGAQLQRRPGQVAEALLQPRRAAVEPAARRGVLEGQVVEAGAGAEAEGHLLAELDPVEAEQVAQRGRAAVVAGRVDVAGDRGHDRILTDRRATLILRRRCTNADLKLLRLMRTRGHSPGLESAAKALGKAGNNGARLGRARRRPRPARLGTARGLADLRRARPGRDRPQLRDQAAGQTAAPGARGPAAARRRPQLAQLPLRPRALLLRGGDGDGPGRPGDGRRPRRRPGDLARPPLPGHALPVRRPGRRPARRRSSA